MASLPYPEKWETTALFSGAGRVSDVPGRASLLRNVAASPRLPVPELLALFPADSLLSSGSGGRPRCNLPGWNPRHARSDSRAGRAHRTRAEARRRGALPSMEGRGRDSLRQVTRGPPPSATVRALPRRDGPSFPRRHARVGRIPATRGIAGGSARRDRGQRLGGFHADGLKRSPCFHGTDKAIGGVLLGPVCPAPWRGPWRIPLLRFRARSWPNAKNLF